MNEAARRTLYSNHEVKMLLRQMLKDEPELVPEYDQNVGFRYPQAEQFIVGPITESLYIIRKLYEAGILLKKHRDKAVACPSCLSPAVSVRYLCVACNSSNMEKRRIWRHAGCGFCCVDESIGMDEEIVCSKCGKKIQKNGMKELEASFYCKDCGATFDKPTWMHFCKKCKFNFTLNEASFIDVYSYVLSDDIRKEFELGKMSVIPVSVVFAREGFVVSAPGSLQGKSGSLHHFDILATGRVAGKEATIVLDLLYSTGPLDLSSVSTLIGKLIDTGVDIGLLVAIPGLDQTGKNLAELYNIETIEAGNSQEAAERLEKKLRRLTGHTPH